MLFCSTPKRCFPQLFSLRIGYTMEYPRIEQPPATWDTTLVPWFRKDRRWLAVFYMMSRVFPKWKHVFLLKTKRCRVYVKWSALRVEGLWGCCFFCVCLFFFGGYFAYFFGLGVPCPDGVSMALVPRRCWDGRTGVLAQFRFEEVRQENFM